MIELYKKCRNKYNKLLALVVKKYNWDRSEFYNQYGRMLNRKDNELSRIVKGIK